MELKVLSYGSLEKKHFKNESDFFGTVLAYPTLKDFNLSHSFS